MKTFPTALGQPLSTIERKLHTLPYMEVLDIFFPYSSCMDWQDKDVCVLVERGNVKEKYRQSFFD